MSYTKYAAAGVVLALMGSAAMAGDARIHPYHKAPNFCPSGLQPVSVGGVICCGTPNTNETYASWMAHPQPKKVHKVRHAKASHVADCPEGSKGCF